MTYTIDTAIWKNTPKDLLMYIFQHLKPIVLNSILIKYMSSETIMFSIRNYTLSNLVYYKLYLLCKAYISHMPQNDILMDLHNVYNYQMSHNFIKIITTHKKTKYNVLWTTIIKSQHLSDTYIKQLIINGVIDIHTYIDDILKYQQLSETYLEELIDTECINNETQWSYVFRYQILSEEFIIKFIEYAKWDLISKYQYLSTEFMKTYSGVLIWDS